MSAENIPDVWLERYLLDELPSPEREQVGRALLLDRELTRRLEQLKASGEQLLRRLPPGQLAEQVSLRARGAKKQEPRAARQQLSRLAFSPVGAGVLALVLVAGVTVPLFWRGGADHGQEEVVRQKGTGPKLLIFRKTADGAEQLAPGRGVAQNDVLQLSYHAAGSKFGAIFSLDGRGAITQHLPEQGVQAAELLSGPAVPLNSAYRLDDAPRMEVFFFVTSDRRFSLKVIRDTIARSGANWVNVNKRLSLPTAYQQSVVLLKKESNR